MHEHLCPVSSFPKQMNKQTPQNKNWKKKSNIAEDVEKTESSTVSGNVKCVITLKSTQ